MVTLRDVPAWLHVAMSVVWIAVELAIALAAFCRFRSTPSGLVLGGAFLARGVVATSSTLLSLFVLREAAWNATGRLVATFGQSAAYLVLNLAIAVGIALIPNSLRRLDR
jgi:hypothetical protein